MYTNPNRSFSAKTLAAVVTLAVAFGVACACGYELFAWLFDAIQGH